MGETVNEQLTMMALQDVNKKTLSKKETIALHILCAGINREAFWELSTSDIESALDKAFEIANAFLRKSKS